MRKQFLEAGRVVGTHGVKGELRVEPWCDSAAFLAKIHTLYWDRGSEELQVVSSRVHKSLLLLKLEGVDTVEQQIAIARKKAGIAPHEPCALERFEVVRHH